MNELLNFVRVTNGLQPIPDDAPPSIWVRHPPEFFSVFWKPVMR